jgi:hypothetical protein
VASRCEHGAERSRAAKQFPLHCVVGRGFPPVYSHSARPVSDTRGQLVVEAGDGRHHAATDERDRDRRWYHERPHEAVEPRLGRRNPGEELYPAHHPLIDRPPEPVVLRQSARPHELREDARVPREVNPARSQGRADPMGDVKARRPDWRASLLGLHQPGQRLLAVPHDPPDWVSRPVFHCLIDHADQEQERAPVEEEEVGVVGGERRLPRATTDTWRLPGACRPSAREGPECEG